MTGPSLAAELGVHTNTIYKWAEQFKGSGKFISRCGVFEAGRSVTIESAAAHPRA